MTLSNDDKSDFASHFYENLTRSVGQILIRQPQYVRIDFTPPLTQSQCEKINQTLGGGMPTAMCELFTNVASELEFCWGLKTPFEAANIDAPIFVGFMKWNANDLVELQQVKRNTEKGTVFEPFWHDLWPLVDFGNGDCIAVSGNLRKENEVYYLTPDDSSSCSVRLGINLDAFLLAWSSLACVGDSSLLQFSSLETGQLDLESSASVIWKNWLEKEDGL